MKLYHMSKNQPMLILVQTIPLKVSILLAEPELLDLLIQYLPVHFGSGDSQIPVLILNYPAGHT